MKQKFILLISFFFLAAASANANWIAGNSSVSPSSPIPACSTVTATGTFTWLSFSAFNNDLHLATLYYALPPSAIGPTGTPSLLVNSVPFPAAIFTQNGNGWNCDFPTGTVFPAGAQLTFAITGLDLVNTPAFTNQQLTHFISFVAGPAGEDYTDNTSTITYATIPVPTVAINASATAISVGDSVTLTASGAISHTWDSAIVQNGVAFAPAVGTHVYTATGTDANGCTGTASVTITVAPTTGNWIAADESVSPSSPIPACSTLTASGSFTWLSFDPFPNDNHNITLSYDLPASVVIASGTPVLKYLNNTPVVGAIFVMTATGYDCTFAPGTVFPMGTKFIFEIAGLEIIDTPSFTNQPLTHSIAFGTSAVGESALDNTKTITFNTIAIPTVTANASATVLCAGDSLTLTGSGTATSYAWNNSATDGVAFAPPTGTNTYVVTGTDINSCTATDTIDVLVNALPNAQASASPNPGCVGDTVTFTATGGTSYLWNDAGATATASFTEALTATTTYSVTVTDINSCVAMDTVTATINTPVPFDSIVASATTICAGDDISINTYPGVIVTGAFCASNATSTGDTKIDTFSFAGTTVGTAPNVGETYTDNTATVIPAAAGVALPLSIVNGSASSNHYAARVKVFIDYNQSNSFEATEMVYEFGQTTALGTIPPTTVTIPTSAFNGQTRMRVVLREGGTTTNTQACGTYTWGETEDYTVNISGGATPPVQSFASVTWNPGTYLSSTSGDAISAQGMMASTVYTATGTDTNGCVSMDSVSITVNQLPVVAGTATPDTLCVGGTVALNGSGTAATYVWEPGTLSGLSQSVTPVTSTDYMLAGTDLNGCVGMDTVAVYVHPMVSLTAAVDTNESCPNNMDGIAYAVSPGQAVPLYTEGFVTAPTFSAFLPNAAAPGWTTSNTSGVRWKVDNNGLNSSNTGPVSGANTPGYIFLETSSSGTPDTLTSPSVDLTLVSAPIGVEFYTHMFGATMNKMELYVDNGTTLTQLWSDSGQIQASSTAPWDLRTVNLDAYAGQMINLRFVGTRGTSFTGDMAIDDVNVFTNPPNTLLWSTAATTDTITGLTAGTYTVTATDVNTGCTASDSVMITVGSEPTLAVSATPGTVACAGDTVTLVSGAAAYDVLTWNGTATAGADTVLAPAIMGMYTVVATDTTSGCTATDSIMVTVNTPVPFDSLLASATTICAGDSISINAYPGVIITGAFCASNATSTGDTKIDTFSFAGTTVGTAPNVGETYTDNTATVIPAAAGVALPLSIVNGSASSNHYAARVKVFIDYNQSNSFEATEMVYEFGQTTALGTIPPTTVTIPTSAFNGQTRMRVVLREGGTTTNTQACGTYTWGETEDYTVNISGGATPPVQSFASVTWNPGTYLSSTSGDAISAQGMMASTVYTATGTDTNGCVSMDSVSITVNQLPVVAGTATPDTLCVGGTVALNGSGTAATYVWEPGTLSGLSQSVTPVTSTDYMLAGTDLNGCVGMDTVAVYVHPMVSLTAAVDTNESCPNNMDGIAYAVSPGQAVPLYTEGFVTAPTFSAFLPNAAAPGWTTSNTSGVRWKVDNNGLNSSNTGPVSGANTPGYIFLETSSSGTPDTLTSPSVDLTLVSAPIGVEFYTHMFGATMNKMELYVDNGTTLTQLWSDSGQIQASSTAPWDLRTVNLDAYAGQMINLRFVGTRGTSFTGDMAIDDVNVFTNPPNTLLWSTAATTDTITGLTAGTYTVTATDVNTGCTASDSVMITAPIPSGDLTQATATNASSLPGSSCDILDHPNDGLTYGYYDTACNIIASVQEPVGGASLGNVTTCATVDATVQVYQGQPYVARHFDITPTTQGPAQVTLYYTDADFANYNANRGSFDSIATNAGAATTATICITQVSGGPLGTGTPTVHGPLTATWDALTQRWEVSFPVTGFSKFFCHTCNPLNAALSVDYKSFTVTKQETSDLVQWTTVSEFNNSHFNVERSGDGQVFTSLGTVYTKATNGNSSTELNYSFVDENPMIGHNYYRLQQVDRENRMTYTEVIDIVWGADGSVVSIYPNPAKNILNIDISSAKATQTEIKLLDMSGRVVKSILAQTQQGMNHITLEIDEVAVGVYGVQVFENNKLTHVSKVRKN